MHGAIAARLRETGVDLADFNVTVWLFPPPNEFKYQWRILFISTESAFHFLPIQQPAAIEWTGR
jgi:hypothetical protein